VTQLVIIAIYLALLLGLGLFASRLFRGTSRDYMLASHSIGPFLLLMSIFGTTMTAFALVGSTGEAYQEGIGVYGLLASSSGIVHSLCIFLLGPRLWSFGRRYGYATQIQFFRERLDSDKLGLLLFPVLVGLVIPYLLIGVLAGGSVVSEVTQGAFPSLFAETNGGVPRWLASLVICCVVLTYVFFGGMRGTAWANTFQTSVFMILGVVTFYVIASKLGGQDCFLENLRTASAAVDSEKLTRAHMSKLVFFTYMLIPLSIGMFPHVFQHWLTARSASAFKLPIVMHPIFILIVWMPCVLVGVWATSDLAAVPADVRANNVLAYMVRNLAGEFLGGLLTAGVLAAIMSSLDSQFLCLGTMFTEDVVVHYGGKQRFNDRQVVMLARGFIIAIVAVTYAFSLLEPRRVFTLGVWCFSGFSSLFPLALAAVYWKRLTKAGAYACVVTAFAAWLYLFAASNFAKDAHFTVDFTWNGQTYQTLPVAAMVVCSTAAMVLVSVLTKPPKADVLAKFFSNASETV
jgi:solute:Na+ symporter, SSS family